MALQLLLHIGMPKTGTSALQVWFAQNADALDASGIAYRNAPESSLRGGISTGNGGQLASQLDTLARQSPSTALAALKKMLPVYFGTRTIALLSSEAFARLRRESIGLLAEACGQQAIKLTVLCYVRHLYDHCYALYQQAVKRHALSLCFVDYIAHYENHQFNDLERWSAVFPDGLRVFSYDEHRPALIAHFLRALGVTSAPDAPPARTDSVNRGLDLAEIEWLRALNPLHGGRLGRVLSDAVLDADPHRPISPCFSAQACQALEARFAPQLAAFNRKYFDRSDGPVRIAHPGAVHWPALHQSQTVVIEPSLHTILTTLVDRALATERIYQRIQTDPHADGAWKKRWQRRWYRWRYGIEDGTG